MSRMEKHARRVVRQTNGLSPGFRYFDNPYEGQTIVCPLCQKTIAAGLETCPKCGKPIPGQQHSREKLRTSPGVILMILLLAAVFVLGIYFFIQQMIESGFMALLLGR